MDKNRQIFFNYSESLNPSSNGKLIVDILKKNSFHFLILEWFRELVNKQNLIPLNDNEIAAMLS